MIQAPNPGAEAEVFVCSCSQPLVDRQPCPSYCFLISNTYLTMGVQFCVGGGIRLSSLSSFCYHSPSLLLFLSCASFSPFILHGKIIEASSYITSIIVAFDLFLFPNT
ncbi:uncharacterized protein TrAFT101_000367 [Trichoderma asperellum]|uniref:uncharacterized protein n=1 Tax=Trichoderma asperellum TaxID=101201 RepID=UPI00332B03D6|nr:hypothetical protein TrAFT101_000367 [Trichoderma asperellum]